MTSAILILVTLAVLTLPLTAGAQTQTPSSPAQTAPSPAIAAQTGPPTTPAVVPLGISGALTPWLQVRGELRTRVEGFTGGGFTSGVPGSKDAYFMDRFRLNATVRPSQTLSFVVQAQDSRAFDKTAGAKASPLRNTFDLRMAYGEFGASTTVRVGRQELAFGEQRLIGHANWLNNARTFDGGRLTLKRQGLQLDAFAASVVTIRPEAFDKSGSGNALYGAYASLNALLPSQAVEPYFFWRRSPALAAELGGTATINQATTGIRMAGKLAANVDYSGEAAIQTGSLGPDAVRAWGGHALVGKTFGSVASKPRLFGEYNYASGDSDPADGRRGTFDQLYPTAHDKYGLADQVGWRNIEHLRTGVELKPTQKLQLSGGYHSWWLASATDALYGAGGTAVVRSTAGTAGTHVGQEIDIQAAFAYSPQFQINGGYAYLVPGQFLKNLTPGRHYSYPFIMATYVFLGEQPALGGRRAQ